MPQGGPRAPECPSAAEHPYDTYHHLTRSRGAAEQRGCSARRGRPRARQEAWKEARGADRARRAAARTAERAAPAARVHRPRLTVPGARRGGCRGVRCGRLPRAPRCRRPASLPAPCGGAHRAPLGTAVARSPDGVSLRGCARLPRARVAAACRGGAAGGAGAANRRRRAARSRAHPRGAHRGTRPRGGAHARHGGDGVLGAAHRVARGVGRWRGALAPLAPSKRAAWRLCVVVDWTISITLPVMKSSHPPCHLFLLGHCADAPSKAKPQCQAD